MPSGDFLYPIRKSAPFSDIPVLYFPSGILHDFPDGLQLPG